MATRTYPQRLSLPQALHPLGGEKQLFHDV